MKYFLFVLLISIMGCGETAYPNLIENPKQFKPLTSGLSNGIMWACSQDMVNDQTVWITCDFVNISQNTADACIRVVYNSKFDLVQETVESRKVCSGLLSPETAHENYVAFYGKNREALDKVCDKDLHLCYLTSKGVQ